MMTASSSPPGLHEAVTMPPSIKPTCPNAAHRHSTECRLACTTSYLEEAYVQRAYLVNRFAFGIQQEQMTTSCCDAESIQVNSE